MLVRLLQCAVAGYYVAALCHRHDDWAGEPWGPAVLLVAVALLACDAYRGEMELRRLRRMGLAWRLVRDKFGRGRSRPVPVHAVARAA